MNKGKKAEKFNKRKFKAKLMLKRWPIKENNIFNLNSKHNHKRERKQLKNKFRSDKKS
jgi:hypothetical protein